MSYVNVFLRDFKPVFMGILKAKHLAPECVALEVIDEEPTGPGVFEPAGVKEVLEQLKEELNFLTIYTERPAYFHEFAETMYEENGLIVTLFPKVECTRRMRQQKQNRVEERTKMVSVLLDFEWTGACHMGYVGAGGYYIPIHKKPWKQGENLDIMVPIGYNTVIVKDMQNIRKRPRRDRFEAAFYE